MDYIIIGPDPNDYADEDERSRDDDREDDIVVEEIERQMERDYEEDYGWGEND